MKYGKLTFLLASAGASSLPALHATAFRLWWIVMTLTLLAAATALWRLVPRTTE
ncbi:hypothetical protein [Streptomyces gibsoniae]|uniref:Uncharacterized protein n=1 Tax=Streptomyces gibsoniae TaxID=3075529 RepID=A0ABU2TMH3_9ACTN|nr:hypothetical protein [Streptomyces sp. DSM 41699]MDT0462140.1 hypothetical protein [Streptomyces sp. DSM 41699]